MHSRIRRGPIALRAASRDAMFGVMGGPFPIATIDLPNGGRIGICPLPGGGGMYERDVLTVLGWNPDAVVSMTETEEARASGGGELPRRLADAGVRWRHFPIRDFGGPEHATAAAWPDLSAQLHAILDGGGAVLLHCRGGRGRSGMVALRLLAERGEVPEAALARIRAARPGAIETQAQFAWSAEGYPVR